MVVYSFGETGKSQGSSHATTTVIEMAAPVKKYG
jgi:hypothetical protein